ncbi:MAG: hypothetical protein RLZZ244_2672 [Verrucomicrobiota bacterium]|jgi:glycosyltransferase involved in cell wall biosynthesis
MTPASQPHISFILTAHREGLLVQSALRSLLAAKTLAESAGLSIEVLASLDSPDPLTASLLEQSPILPLKLLHLHHRDAGLSRNAAVAAASGTFIAFLDADDLWQPHWPLLAFQAAQKDPRSIVWHPELSIVFGEEHSLFLHIDMESPLFQTQDLAHANYWTSLCFAPRSLLAQIPYPPTDPASGLGYEDWSWNLRVIEAGSLHKSVPNTCHAIRRKAGTLSRLTHAFHSKPAPSRLFHSLLSQAREQGTTPVQQHGGRASA